MRFDVITLFPEMFEPFLTSGVARRAYELELVDVRLHNPRNEAQGSYKRVDDRPFGGGPGMVMMADPLYECLQKIQQSRLAPAPVVLFSPSGRPFTHAMVERWACSQGAVLVCGRYEGVDQRFINACVDEEYSLGDFVLSGGEIPAIALLDAVARLQRGVLGDAESHKWDSFNPSLSGLLDCPHYTRPESWRGDVVPEVLVSGHHAHIQNWRREQSLMLSASLRPDLIEKARSAGQLSATDEKFLDQLF
jgi:tRNA (guanine37-N1)-methyltransferase